MIAWRDRIQQNGNQPADWLQYLRFMRDNMTVKSHKSVTQLNNMYAYAFQVSPPYIVQTSLILSNVFYEFRYLFNWSLRLSTNILL